MRNFRIDASGALRRREGYRRLCGFPQGTRGFCYGIDPESNEDAVFYCHDRRLFRWILSTQKFDTLCTISELDLSGKVTLFLLSGRLYLLDGKDYYYWSPQGFGRVEGYIPLCYTDVKAENGIGTDHEVHNELSPFARAQYSFAESSRIFLLPEQASEVMWVKVDGALVTYTVEPGYSDYSRLQVNLDGIARPGKNAVEICYRLPQEGRRAKILNNLRVFLYGGSDDLRLFLYGDGSGQVQYSVSLLDYYYAAEYFPKEGYISVATGPVTGIVRRYNHLLIHTAKETFAVESADDRYRVYLVHDRIGNQTHGYAQPVEGDSVTVSGGAIYRMKMSSLQGDRIAVCISDRVQDALRKEDLQSGLCTVSPNDCEVWYAKEDAIYIYRYDRDVWYQFDNPGVEAFFVGSENRVGFLRDNYLYLYDRDCQDDDGAPIHAYWQSAPFAFSHRRPICEAAMQITDATGRGQVHLSLRCCEDAVANQTDWEEADLKGETALHFLAYRQGTHRPISAQKVRLHAGNCYLARFETKDDVTVSFFGVRQRDGRWEADE